MPRLLRNYFVTGLIIFTPFIVTLYILWESFLFLDSLIGQYIELIMGRSITGLGFVVLVALIFIIGILATNFVGRSLIKVSEDIIEKIPLAKTIYNSVKGVINPLLSTTERIFSRCVLVEYPRKGVYSLGFVTSENRGEVQSKTSEKVINVFVATTPNPTSGYLLFVPEEQTIPLNMSVEDGMKLIISGGFVVPKTEEPQNNEEKEKSL
jgi:uncharacterized membrane protein